MFKKRLNKIIIYILLIIIFTSFWSTVFADEVDEDLDFVWLEEELSKSKEVEDLKINSKVAVAYDRNSKDVLFGKNENQKVKMASTTKIMTGIVLLENVQNLNEQVEVCKEAAVIGGSRLGLKTGDKITYNDLLYGLLLCSGNDCAIQIAISVSKSIEEFANLMNKKAKELGLKSTHFVTPHGLDKEEHYTTGLELAKITDYALNIDKFKEVVKTKTYTVKINNYTKTISNTNELLGNLQGVNGVKTGFTNGAGRCLVTSIDRNGFDIITVILGADTKKMRTKDSINLIEYVYKNYEIVNLEEIIEEEFNKWKQLNNNRIYINKGITQELELELEKNNRYKNYPIKKEYKDKIQIKINTIDYADAPLEKGELIGELTIKVAGKAIGNIKILNKNKIEKMGVIDYLKMCLKQIFSIDFL